MSIASQPCQIIAGVDTHKDTHTVAAIDTTGRLYGSAQFPADPAGYRDLLSWWQRFGPVTQAGVEGTSCYGAGLTV